MKAQIHTFGVPEMADWLARVAPNEAIKALRGSVGKEARRVRDIAKSLAPIEVALDPRHPGRLRNAIRAKSGRPSKTNKAQIIGGAYVKQGKTRKDLKGAYYAHMVEWGTVKQAAKPFMRPAMSRAIPGLKTEFSTSVIKRLKAAIRRNAKAAAR